MFLFAYFVKLISATECNECTSWQNITYECFHVKNSFST